MSEHRFYLAPEDWPDAPQGEALLEGQEAVHLAQSLRLGPGTDVGLLDGRGRTGLFTVVESGKATTTLPYNGDKVWLRLRADGTKATLEYGTSGNDMRKAADIDLTQLADDGKLNRFNGLGVGIYATALGKKTRREARFDFFSYKDN